MQRREMHFFLKFFPKTLDKPVFLLYLCTALQPEADATPVEARSRSRRSRRSRRSQRICRQPRRQVRRPSTPPLQSTHVADVRRSDTYLADAYRSDLYLSDSYRSDSYLTDFHRTDLYLADFRRSDTYLADSQHTYPPLSSLLRAGSTQAASHIRSLTSWNTNTSERHCPPASYPTD